MKKRRILPVLGTLVFGGSLLGSALLAPATYAAQGDIDWAWDRTNITSIVSGAEIAAADDGGYFVIGRKDNSMTDSDGVLIKSNKEGIKLWERIWGGTGHDNFFSIEATDDGGCVVVGYFSSTTIGGIDSGTPLNNQDLGDAMMIKYDQDGLVEWQTSWGDAYWNSAQDVTVTDEGYAVLGESVRNSNEPPYPEVMIFDSNGIGLKKHSFTAEDGEGQADVGGMFINSIKATGDQEYILFGSVSAGTSSILFEEQDLVTLQGSVGSIDVVEGDNGQALILQIGDVSQQAYLWGGSGEESFYNGMVTDGWLAVGYSGSDMVSASGSGEIIEKPDNLSTQAVVVKFSYDGVVEWQKGWVLNNDSNSNYFHGVTP